MGDVGALEDVGDFIGCKVCDKLGGYNTFKDLRVDWEVRDGSVVGGRQRIKVGLFKDRGNDCFFEIGRDGAGRKWTANDLMKGGFKVLIIFFSIGRGRGSRDEVEEVDLRREMIWSNWGDSNCSRDKGKVMGVLGMTGMGRVERMVESFSLKDLSKRSGSSSGVTVGRGDLSERSWEESLCIDLLSLASLSNLWVMWEALAVEIASRWRFFRLL